MPKRANLIQRKEGRQDSAKFRQEAYNKLSLAQKIEAQYPYQGKQYRKLCKQLETDANGCYTLPNGECISVVPCMHKTEVTQ